MIKFSNIINTTLHNNHFCHFSSDGESNFDNISLTLAVHDRSRSFVLGHLCLADITTCSYEETKVYSMTSCICIIALSDAVIDGTSKYHHDS